MGVKKFIRRQKGSTKTPKERKVKRLMEKLPSGYKAETGKHVNLVTQVADAIAAQLKAKGVKVNSRLLHKMAASHDVFRHVPGHERIAQNYFARKGFGVMAKGIGRHAASKPERIPHFSLEEKVLIYCDEVSRWNGKKGKESRHEVLPLETAIENLKARYADNPEMVRFIEEEGQGIRRIEHELKELGFNPKKLAGMHV
jgi:hypothetical protein